MSTVSNGNGDGFMKIDGFLRWDGLNSLIFLPSLRDSALISIRMFEGYGGTTRFAINLFRFKSET